MALSVSSKQLALYVDCSLMESVDWVYHGMGISTDGLIMVGGIIEGFETPLEVSGLLTKAILPKMINHPSYHLFC